MIDNKKLMDAIDSLDNDENYDATRVSKVTESVRETRKKDDVIKEGKSSDRANTILVIFFLIMIITAVIYYTSPLYNDEEVFASISSQDEEGVYEVGENGVITVNAPESTNIVNSKDIAKIESNIIIDKEFIDYRKQLNFLIKNTNNVDVNSISIEVVFYDGEGKIIEIDSSNLEVLAAGLDRYVSFYETPEKYERYDVLIQVDKDAQNYYSSKLNDVSYECLLNKEDDEVIIRGKNNSSEKLEYVIFEIIHYDDKDNVINVKEAFEFDIRKNKSFEIDEYIDLYDDETYDPIAYSRYEIRLVEAYSLK